MCCSNHWPIIRIVSAKAVDGHLATARARPGYTHMREACRKRPASASQSVTVNDFGNFPQGRSDKAVSGRIDSQFIEPASYLSAIKQSVPFGFKKIDAPAQTTKNRLPQLVTITQVVLNAALNLTAEHFCHQIRNVIGVIFYVDLCLFEIPEEIRCVQHKQPKVAHRDAADTTNPVMGV